MSSFVYRQASGRDAGRLAELRWRFKTEEETPPPDASKDEFLVECAEFLSRGIKLNWTYFVAEADGKIVSHAFVQRVAMVPKPGRTVDEWGYVTNCFTLPEFRGRGIGRILMEHLIAWARECDLELLIVWPSDESVEYYKRLGFENENDVLQFSLRDE